jgi:hypothetical protein
MGFHKLQCYSDEIVPSESVFVFCHSKNLSECARSIELVQGREKYWFGFSCR